MSYTGPSDDIDFERFDDEPLAHLPALSLEKCPNCGAPRSAIIGWRCGGCGYQLSQHEREQHPELLSQRQPLLQTEEAHRLRTVPDIVADLIDGELVRRRFVPLDET